MDSILIRLGEYHLEGSWRRILIWNSTFMGIAIHNLSASGADPVSLDLAAGVRQDASGILGTTVQPADLVRLPSNLVSKLLIR